MADYFGNKSFDAEITVDFSTNEILMDYSLNAVSNRYDSNVSVIQDEFDNLRLSERIKDTIKRIPHILFAVSYLGFTSKILTFMFHHNLVKNKNFQFEHQKILRDNIINIIGIEHEIYKAPFLSNNLICHMAKNVWVKYKLEGDCQEEIKTISLKRHYYEFLRFGKYKSIRQDGWDLIFEFEHIPQNGCCIIEYV